MPFVHGRGDARIHYQSWGEGDEAVVFAHGYLMNHHMFAHQIERLKARRRVIAYDHRGHGQSDPWHAPYDLELLVDDAARVIEKAAGGPVHFVGMSTGGFVAQRLLLQRPELLRSATLIDTSAHAEPPEAMAQYEQLLGVIAAHGIEPVLDTCLGLLMGERFRTDPGRAAEFAGWKAAIRALDPRSIVLFGRAVFGRDAVLEPLKAVTAPTRVIVGAEDVPTPPVLAEALAGALGAELTVIEGAGHTSPLEVPAAVSDAIETFLDGLSPAKA